MKKVAVIGAHGIGKTTLVTKYYLYSLDKGINSRVIREVARDCPLGINDKFNENSAVWIVSEQIKRELDAKSKNIPLVICDRSSIDPIMYAYTKFGNLDTPLLSSLLPLATSWLATYDRIIWLRPSGIAIKGDGIRDVNESFQKSVDNAFETFMRQYTSKNPQQVVITLSSSAIYKRELDLFFQDQLVQV